MAEAQGQEQKSKDSILDRVLSSQHAAAIERFVPTETLWSLAKTLTEKESDVIRRRFGLNGNNEETLEEIGKRYGVTRERIRQIENASVQKMLQAKTFREVVVPVERLLVSTLTAHGGIMEEQLFYQHALAHAGGSVEQHRALEFLLTKIFTSNFEHLPGTQELRPAWKLRAQSLDLALRAIRTIVELATKLGKPSEKQPILDAFRTTPLTAQHAAWFTDDVVTSYLSLSRQISRNPFGEYGLTAWGTVVPKRMNDKIYLVLKKHGKPLHFTEITRLINEAGFDHRKAYAPTVHNELILNSHYVLVGRGIYALKEWGFQAGVVADVITDILKHAEHPMTREDVVTAVLKQRYVKRNTILLALTNKKLFRRTDAGEYELATTVAT